MNDPSNSNGTTNGLHLNGTSTVAPKQRNAKRLQLEDETQRLVIRASAGTGKTFQLTNRYLTLLRIAPVESILASTFTRKAAGEILERILLRLSLAVLDKQEYEALKPFLGEPAISQKECETLLIELTRNLHRVRISTLDGFFARLAGSFSLELGLPPGWRMLEGLEAEELKARSIESILSKDAQETKQLMHLLDKGNTSRSVYQLISGKVDSFYDVFLNSQKSAWERLPQLPFLSEEQRLSIIEQLAALSFEDGRLGTARDKDVEKMRKEQWDALISTGLMPRVLNNPQYYNKELPSELMSLYRDILPHIKAEIITPWASQTKATYQLLDDFHKVYEDAKVESRGFLFNDITRRLAEATQKRTTSQLAYRLDGHIDHVLLDEFQDTSPLQWRAIHPFADKACRSDDSSFFCVGDVKQAIYGWRGGEAAIFDEIESELPGIESQELNRSFRSSPVIMDVVNQIFKGMGRHDGLEDLETTLQHWSHDFPKHSTAKDELPGFATLVTSPFPEGVERGDGNASSVTDELWKFTAQYVKDRLEEAPNANIAVLTRKNSGVGRMIFLLNQLGIDASEEGGNPLTDSAAVQLVLSLMRLADHPGHSAALFHVVNSPLGPIMDLVDHTDVNRAHAFAQEFRQRLMGGYGPVIHELTAALASACNDRELRRMIQLSAQADNFDAFQLPLRPGRFVDYIEQQKVQEPTDSRVRVMTVHQSKGLEFDTVIVPELDELLTKPPSAVGLSASPTAKLDFVALAHNRADFELLPDELSKAYGQTMSKLLEESLCLLYVSLTRAIHSLHLIIKPRHAKSAEAHFPKTFAGLIRAAIAPEKENTPDKVLYELGDRDWFNKTPGKTDVPESQLAPTEQLQINFAESDRSRRVQKIAPSMEEGDRYVRLSNVLPVGNSAAMDRGTLFHKWMEQIRWLDESRPSDVVLRRLGRELGAQHLNIDRCVSQFHTMIRVPQVAYALSKRAYQPGSEIPLANSVLAELNAGPVDLEVINERPFSVMNDDRLINGSIDRLVLISRNWQLLAADVIDFKTDALPDDPAAIEERIEHYRGQLEAYVNAVSQIYHLPTERISARLVLLSIGRVETLSLSAKPSTPRIPKHGAQNSSAQRELF